MLLIEVVDVSEEREWHKKRAFESELKILRVLADKEWHRYIEFEQETGLAKRTIAKTLARMVKDGRIERRVDIDSGAYPPPVYYKISYEIEDITGMELTFLSQTAVYHAVTRKLEKSKTIAEYFGILNDFLDFKLLRTLILKKENVKRWDGDLQFKYEASETGDEIKVRVTRALKHQLFANLSLEETTQLKETLETKLLKT